MYGEADMMWAKTGERGNKRGYNRGPAKSEEEGFRYVSTRKEDRRAGDYKGRSTLPTGKTSESQVQRQSPKETREEGEIVVTEEKSELMPSKEFEKALAETQADGNEAMSDPVDAANGAHMLETLLEKQVTLSDDEIMTYGEIRSHLLSHGIDVDAVEIGEEESEMEMEDMMQQEMTENPVIEEGNLVKALEGQEVIVRDTEKKQGTRKKLFKPAIATAGSNKMRLASAMVSPRKRAPPKQVPRQGDNAKQAESKGASNPKSGPMN